MVRLGYLEMRDVHGRAVVANGVVQMDKVDTLGGKRALAGRGMRMYLPDEGDGDSVGLVVLQTLLGEAPRALAGVLNSLTGTVVGKRFASVDLVRHGVQFIDIPTSNIDDLVASWWRVQGNTHALLELDSSREAMDVLVKELLAPVRGTKPEAREIGRTAESQTGRATETSVSAQRRERLARGWLDAEHVSERMGSRAENRSQMASDARRKGLLLGVWIVNENRYRYPEWQFTAAGKVLPEMKPLLNILRGPHGVAGGRPTSGWEEIEWFQGPHALLDGETPAAMLAKDPGRVLAVAKRQFAGDVDANW